MEWGWGWVRYGYGQGETMAMFSKCGLLVSGCLQTRSNCAKVPLVEPQTERALAKRRVWYGIR
jgi:hypothetical protein